MKLICSKANLLYGVNTAIKAVPTRTTMPILECILIDASEGEIKLIANDMELAIQTSIEGTIKEPGVIALDAKIFQKSYESCLTMILRLPLILLLKQSLLVKKQNLILLANQEKTFHICLIQKKMKRFPLRSLL